MGYIGNSSGPCRFKLSRGSSSKIRKKYHSQQYFAKVCFGRHHVCCQPRADTFWFGWSTVLFAKKVLLPRSSHYNLYIIGIGIGTLIGNCVFIFGGQLIAEKLKSNQNILNWVIGGIFTITA
jgi:hypothetical protein